MEKISNNNYYYYNNKLNALCISWLLILKVKNKTKSVQFAKDNCNDRPLFPTIVRVAGSLTLLKRPSF